MKNENEPVNVIVKAPVFSLNLDVDPPTIRTCITDPKTYFPFLEKVFKKKEDLPRQILKFISKIFREQTSVNHILDQDIEKARLIYVMGLLCLENKMIDILSEHCFKIQERPKLEKTILNLASLGHINKRLKSEFGLPDNIEKKLMCNKIVTICYNENKKDKLRELISEFSCGSKIGLLNEYELIEEPLKNKLKKISWTRNNAAHTIDFANKEYKGKRMLESTTIENFKNDVKEAFEELKQIEQREKESSQNR